MAMEKSSIASKQNRRKPLCMSDLGATASLKVFPSSELVRSGVAVAAECKDIRVSLRLGKKTPPG